MSVRRSSGWRSGCWRSAFGRSPAGNDVEEKVWKDLYRETRYLIGSIQRLLAAVVLTSQLTGEQTSVPSIIQNLQYLCSKLSKSDVELEYLEESAMTRDIVFIFPCRRARTNIHLGVNIYLPGVP